MGLQTRSDMELWDRPFQTLLIGVLAVNVLAHMFTIPWWVLIASASALGWKLGHLYFGWVLPKRPMLYIIAIAIGAGIFLEYKTILGHEAATPILVFLASLKLLETNRDRDAMFIIVTSYFLLMAHLLHSQSLGSTFFMAFDVALITILMYQLHRSDRRITQRSLRPVVRLLIFTIPIWLCLFVVFPRFTIKTFRKNTTVQSTGFSEGLDPGSVSSLAQSNELAFRARFISGPKRSPESLYWRGATLYDFDELKWRPRTETETRRTSTAPPDETAAAETPDVLTYEIVSEPGQSFAVFTLPRVVAFSPGTTMKLRRPMETSDHLIRVTQPGPDHVVYTASSVPEMQGELETMTPELSARTLIAVPDASPQYRALVRTLKQEAISIHHALKNLDDFFTAGDFRYTLSPADAKSRTLDDFLFKNRKGFCEHYAGASAALLRSMGFRARVVVGYQGGKWNDISKALLVRSRDAHAWVEVWTPVRTPQGKGRWITYDPTASIAPLRLRMGGDFLDLPEEQQRSRDLVNSEGLDRLGESFALRALNQSLLVWDYAQMSWTRFLLGYDRSGQRELLNSILAWLGLTSRPWLISALLAAFFGIGLRLLYLWSLRNASASTVQREWGHFEKELTRLGVVRSIQDGPLTLRDRLSSDELKDGVDAFIEIQYGPENKLMHAPCLRRLRKARRVARSLRPPPSP